MKRSKTLSILIPCLESRPWKLVCDELNRQRLALPNNLSNSVEILWKVDNGEETSGVKRNALTKRSIGKYVAFVDDDDKLSEDYLSSILEGCAHDPDVVAFNLEFTNKDDPEVNEVWKFGLYPNKRQSGLMSINHLCAWKRSIATKVAWCPDLGNGDDQLWLDPLIAAGFVSNVYRIDKTLYHYLYDANVTANQLQFKIEQRKTYAGDGLKCFMVNGEIWIQVPPLKHKKIIKARNRFNRVVGKHPSQWPKPYHITRIK